MTQASNSGQSPAAANAADELQREVDQAIALCGGDKRARRFEPRWLPTNF